MSELCAICDQPLTARHRCVPAPIAVEDQCGKLCGFDVKTGKLVSVDAKCPVHAPALNTPKTFEVVVTFEARTKNPERFGYSYRSVGKQTHKVAVVIDVEEIARQLARKAYESKGKRASMAKGAIVVKPLTLAPIG